MHLNGETFLASDIAVGLPDYRGRIYGQFEARQTYIGTGWEVIGRALNVSASVVAHAARPNRPYRHTPRFNGAVRMGWRTKREAQRVADYLNSAIPAHH